MNLAASGMTVLTLIGAAFPIYHLYKNRVQPGAVYLLALCLILVLYPFNLILLEGEAAVLFQSTLASQAAPLFFLTIFAYLRLVPQHWQRIRLGTFAYMLIVPASLWLAGDQFIDFAEVQPHADIREYVYQYGPIGWAIKSGSYTFLLIAGGAVIHRFNASRSNRAHVLGLAILPLAAGLVELLARSIGFSNYNGITALQISMTVAAFGLSYALIRHEMLMRMPVSRNTLMNYLREGVCVVSEQGVIADCNESFALMVGTSTESMLGRVATQVMPEPILAQFDAHRQQKVVEGVEVQIDSGERYLSVSVSALEDSAALVLSATDITEGKRLLVDVAATAGELRTVNERLEEMTLTDPLTGLGNRRKLQNALNALNAIQPDKNHEAMGLIMIDIDHFKAINDTHGHDAGDIVLVELANAMRETCRNNDTLVRWGGEEFVVLVPNCDERRLQIAAQRLRLHVRQLGIVLPKGATVQVTVSIGATVVRSGQSSESALRQVDRLMYEAKQAGRDCVKSSRESSAG